MVNETTDVMKSAVLFAIMGFALLLFVIVAQADDEPYIDTTLGECYAAALVLTSIVMEEAKEIVSGYALSPWSLTRDVCEFFAAGTALSADPTDDPLLSRIYIRTKRHCEIGLAFIYHEGTEVYCEHAHYTIGRHMVAWQEYRIDLLINRYGQ